MASLHKGQFLFRIRTDVSTLSVINTVWICGWPVISKLNQCLGEPRGWGEKCMKTPLLALTIATKVQENYGRRMALVVGKGVCHEQGAIAF